jgi:transcriptional regulator with XRE-family HTH domain
MLFLVLNQQQGEVEMSIFGKRLRQFRQIKGISQAKLQEITGIKREYTSKLEGGGSKGLENPTLNTMQKLADGVGIQLAVLIAPELDLSGEIRRFMAEVNVERTAKKIATYEAVEILLAKCSAHLAEMAEVDNE